jgi:hypothetical protein
VYHDEILAFTSKQRPPIEIPAPGLYSVGVRIPANLLAEEVYTLQLDVVASRADLQQVLPGSRPLTFRVYEPLGGGPGNRNIRGRAGVVAPPLEWEAIGEAALVGS